MKIYMYSKRERNRKEAVLIAWYKPILTWRDRGKSRQAKKADAPTKIRLGHI
jgi:hypothetical protein